MTRLACAWAHDAGVDLLPVLQRAGLTVREVEDENIRLRVTTQIACLNLLAEALGDKLLGLHVAQDMDLRDAGFLYYVAASSETLGGGLQGLARCSSMLNEGVKLETDCGDALQIGFEYTSVSRQSERHQIEAWTTATVRLVRFPSPSPQSGGRKPRGQGPEPMPAYSSR